MVGRWRYKIKLISHEALTGNLVYDTVTADFVTPHAWGVYWEQREPAKSGLIPWRNVMIIEGEAT
jgi:hypothetical protein